MLTNHRYLSKVLMAIVAVVVCLLVVYTLNIQRPQLGNSGPEHHFTLLSDHTQCACSSKLSEAQYQPVGGWEYTLEVIQAHHVSFDDGLGREIVRLIHEKRPNNTGRPVTIVDIGAGVGQFGAWLIENDIRTVDWQGYDGGNNVNSFCGKPVNTWDRQITVPKVCFLDAGQPVYNRDLLGAPFDWVMSVEVGEHIPAANQNNFLDNLVRLSKYGVILSWARPGQGGNGHVNNKANHEIVELLEERGLVYQCSETMKIRKKITSLEWLRHTLMVFRKPQTSEGLFSKLSELLPKM